MQTTRRLGFGDYTYTVRVNLSDLSYGDGVSVAEAFNAFADGFTERARTKRDEYAGAGSIRFVLVGSPLRGREVHESLSMVNRAFR